MSISKSVNAAKVRIIAMLIGCAVFSITMVNAAESDSAVASKPKPQPVADTLSDVQEVPAKAGETALQSENTQSEDARAQVLSTESAAALARLQHYLDSTRSLTANFSSILLDSTGEQLESSSGQVAIKVPGKFRWQYSNPEPSILVSDGIDLWNFDEVLEQVIVRSMSDYRGANPTLLLGGDAAKITEAFEVVGSHITEGDQWLELATKDRDSDFVTVRIKFSNDSIQLMELVDRVDQISRIAYSDVVLNPDLQDELFDFEVPDGASLIGLPSKR